MLDPHLVVLDWEKRNFLDYKIDAKSPLKRSQKLSPLGQPSVLSKLHKSRMVEGLFGIKSGSEHNSMGMIPSETVLVGGNLIVGRLAWLALVW